MHLNSLQVSTSTRLNLEGERSKVLMKISWKHSFFVAQQGEKGVLIYFLKLNLVSTLIKQTTTSLIE